MGERFRPSSFKFQTKEKAEGKKEIGGKPGETLALGFFWTCLKFEGLKGLNLFFHYVGVSGSSPISSSMVRCQERVSHGRKKPYNR